MMSTHVFPITGTGGVHLEKKKRAHVLELGRIKWGREAQPSRNWVGCCYFKFNKVYISMEYVKA